MVSKLLTTKASKWVGGLELPGGETRESRRFCEAPGRGAGR